MLGAKHNHISETFSWTVFAKNGAIIYLVDAMQQISNSERGQFAKSYDPMIESLKSTRSLISCMAGTTRSRKQSRASGHFDIINAERSTVVFVVNE